MALRRRPIHGPVARNRANGLNDLSKLVIYFGARIVLGGIPS